jgi:hypothetical protein
MEESLIDWIFKNIRTVTNRTATLAVSAFAIKEIGSVLKISIINNVPLPANCQTILYEPDARKAYGCRSQATPTPSISAQEKNTLKDLRSLTEIDLEKLFAAGEYNINEKQSSELKLQHSTFQLLAQQNSTVYILGSADKAGDNSFSGSVSNNTCINQGLNQIQLHALTGGTYEKQLSSQKIPSRFTNFDLPQLRARSLQCWLKREYPTISTEILEGEVQSVVSPQYRRVRIFTDKKSTTNQLPSSISSD